MAGHGTAEIVCLTCMKPCCVKCVMKEHLEHASVPIDGLNAFMTKRIEKNIERAKSRQETLHQEKEVFKAINSSYDKV